MKSSCRSRFSSWAQGQFLARMRTRVTIVQRGPRLLDREEPRLGELVADRDRRLLVGAWAVAPLAGEWIHQAALVIRAQIPIDTLLDGIAQFPTYSEAYLKAIERLGL